MRPVSPEFLAAVRGSHTIDVQAIVVEPGQTGVAPTGTAIEVIDGSVDLDATAQTWGTLHLTTPGEGRWPSKADALLAPYGKEIHVKRGIKLGGGVTEWCSLGYYRIDEPEQVDPPNGEITIEAKDRMAGIIDARLVVPIQFSAFDTYGVVIEQMVKEVYPTAVIEWDDPDVRDRSIGRALIADEKRYEFLDDLVTSLGKVWSWDHRGILVIRTPLGPSDAVWDVDAGSNGVLVKLSRKLTRAGVYNAVVATGEATGTDEPVRAVAYNNDPASPTYYRGPFGPVPRFYSSQFLLTNTQCVDAAASLLAKSIGLPYNVDFSAVPNPALEPLDPIRIRYDADGVIEAHVLQKITVPLVPSGVQSASTREQTVVLIGTL